MYDEAIYIKKYGVYMQIQLDDTVYSQNRNEPGEDIMQKINLLRAVENYLGGLDGECRLNLEEHREAAEWIFHSHPMDDLGFDQVWMNFFPYITPDEARKALKETFEQRSKSIHRKGRRDGYKRQSFRGRKKKAVPVRDDSGAGFAGGTTAGQEA